MERLVQVSFYILDDVDYDNKLIYACRIVYKAYKQGRKIVCYVSSKEKGERLNTLLWTFSQGSFIPHTWIDRTPADWQQYPVQIALADNSTLGNKNHALINLADQVPSDYLQFDRVIEIVCQQNQDKIDGRNRFRFYRDNGHQPTTHNV